ncbi:hypothetical protein CGSHiHH_01382 [Haemophilus influenzae PittHH]|nr:hypothetical protein CGSHiHH_01382 [Haemophilus influenzae PittHH]
MKKNLQKCTEKWMQMKCFVLLKLAVAVQKVITFQINTQL